MDATALAMQMLRWEQVQREADALAEEIRAAVLDIGYTHTVGNVRASYSAGRKSYDYRAAADGHKFVSEATVRLFTEFIPETTRVDWKGICQHAGIGQEEIPYTQSEPKVALTLLDRAAHQKATSGDAGPV